MKNSPRRSPATLTLKLGRLLEASATGWAVLLIPLVVALVSAGLVLAALVTGAN